MDLGLKDRVAIITGGSEGIGLATAIRFAREGAAVVICARRPDVLEGAAAEIRSRSSAPVTAVTADVTRQEDVDHLFETAVREHGGVDILVNNAGRAAAGAFETVTDAMWHDDLELKLFGAVRCARAAIPLMRQRGGGRIINLTIPGGKAPEPGSLPTSVSRAAGIALTKALSKEHARDNILVNTVCIGLVKSAQHERRYEQLHETEPDLTLDAFYERVGREVPLGRVGETEEAADVIVFLASARAGYVTGTSVHVDGGISPVV